MKALPWIIVAIVIIGAYYFISKNQAAKIIAADAVISDAVNNAPAPVIVANPPCIPFTQAQQDYEKLHKISAAHCDVKALIPVIGPQQFQKCIKEVNASLTPVNNCQ